MIKKNMRTKALIEIVVKYGEHERNPIKDIKIPSKKPSQNFFKKTNT